MDACAELGDVSDVTQDNKTLLYTVNDKPNWFLSIFLVIQHYLTTFGGVISISFMLAPALCILPNDPSLGHLITSMLMVCGISTLLQATIGVRLPIVQGPSYAFLICILRFLRLPQWTCPSNVDLYSMGNLNRTAEWHDRMLEIQGGVIVVTSLEILIGYTGFIGKLLLWVSPITIASTITLVGASMIIEVLESVFTNWHISLGTFILVFIFSQLLRNIHTPIGCYSFEKGWHISWIKGFQLFSILVPTVLASVICYILIDFGILKNDDPAMMKMQGKTMNLVNWFTIPYPLQWGIPRFTLNSIFSLMPVIFVDIVKSISDYYACASICGKPPPNKSALRRGIGVNGIGSLIAGLCGVGPGVTSHSGNIGAIGITKVGNQRVIILGAITMMLMSTIGKFGALFSLIPSVIIGSLLCTMFTIVSCAGLSHLEHVNMKSHRNLFIFGAAVFFGLAIPHYSKTKMEELTASYPLLGLILTVFTTTPYFIGFILSFILDLILPGTEEERGVTVLPAENTYESSLLYDLHLTKFFKNINKTKLYNTLTTLKKS